MASTWKKNADEYQSSAKVVDGNLILSLPDAINPVVWRMELGSVKASALEVKAQENSFLLLLKTPKGEMHEIAPFASRETAVRALMRVSAALQGAEGRIAPIAANVSGPVQTAYKAESFSYKWILALAGVVGVILLFAYLGSLTPRTGADMAGAAQSETNTESGVPESADQMLKGF